MPESTRLRVDEARNFDEIRGEFSVFHQNIGPYHYLDSAASSHKPGCVIDAVADAYRYQYAPVHRGLYPQAEAASDAYEQARATLAAFINASSANNLVFTHSATESINMVAEGWARSRLSPGDEIWVSEMEHHSNFLPWQRVCRERGAVLQTIPLGDDGQLDIQRASGLFGSKTKLIALTLVSNVLGTINPLAQLTEQAHAHDIPVLVDAAQAVAHIPIDVQTLGCDFLVASAHKMCGPGGIGFLYGTQERLEETSPLMLGGGMVDHVGDGHSSWAPVPARFEAGSPHFAGALGFSAAADYLAGIGLPAIELRVRELTTQASEALSSIEGVTLYGKPGSSVHAGVVSFNLQHVHPHDVAQIAGESGVAIRAGHHCCQPLMQRLGVASTARASFSFYNNEDDILALVDAVQAARKIFGDL